MYGTSGFSALLIGLSRSSALSLSQNSTLPTTTSTALGVGLGVGGAGLVVPTVWFVLRRRMAGNLVDGARNESEELRQATQRDTEALLKEAKIEAREEHLRARQVFEDESRECCGPRDR